MIRRYSSGFQKTDGKCVGKASNIAKRYKEKVVKAMFAQIYI